MTGIYSSINLVNTTRESIVFVNCNPPSGSQFILSDINSTVKCSVGEVLYIHMGNQCSGSSVVSVDQFYLEGSPYTPDLKMIEHYIPETSSPDETFVLSEAPMLTSGDAGVGTLFASMCLFGLSFF